MRTHFVANFQGTRDRPPAVSDMCRIKQQPGETLQKYIQRFNNARLKIPKVTEEAIISAFSDGVRDVKMKEEQVMHHYKDTPYNATHIVRRFDYTLQSSQEIRI